MRRLLTIEVRLVVVRRVVVLVVMMVLGRRREVVLNVALRVIERRMGMLIVSGVVSA